MITFIFAMTEPFWQFVVFRHIKFLLRLLASRLPSHIKLIPSSLQILKLPLQRQQLFLSHSASTPHYPRLTRSIEPQGRRRSEKPSSGDRTSPLVCHRKLHAQSSSTEPH